MRSKKFYNEILTILFWQNHDKKNRILFPKICSLKLAHDVCYILGEPDNVSAYGICIKKKMDKKTTTAAIRDEIVE